MNVSDSRVCSRIQKKSIDNRTKTSTYHRHVPSVQAPRLIPLSSPPRSSWTKLHGYQGRWRWKGPTGIIGRENDVPLDCNNEEVSGRGTTIHPPMENHGVWHGAC